MAIFSETKELQLTIHSGSLPRNPNSVKRRAGSMTHADIDRLEFGHGYRRNVELRETGEKRVYLSRIRYGHFVPNRGSIRNVRDANGVKTGIRYI